MSSVLQLQLAVTAQDRSNYFAVIGLICAVNYHLELKNVFVYCSVFILTQLVTIEFHYIFLFRNQREIKFV